MGERAITGAPLLTFFGARLFVIPAKAGIILMFGKRRWIPAFAGMTSGGRSSFQGPTGVAPLVRAVPSAKESRNPLSRPPWMKRRT